MSVPLPGLLITTLGVVLERDEVERGVLERLGDGAVAAVQRFSPMGTEYEVAFWKACFERTSVAPPMIVMS